MVLGFPGRSFKESKDGSLQGFGGLNRFPSELERFYSGSAIKASH